VATRHALHPSFGALNRAVEGVTFVTFSWQVDAHGGASFIVHMVDRAAKRLTIERYFVVKGVR